MNGKNWFGERDSSVVILQGYTRENDYPEMKFFTEREVHREYEKTVIFIKIWLPAIALCW